LKNGTYIASSSSNAEGKMAWNCLNNSTTDYWHSEYSNSGNNIYATNPYDSITPVASYRGGGSSYYYNTIIDTISYAGEWIQIQFPYQFILTKYTLKTRDGYTWAQRGFKKFYIAGSNNGSTWYMVNAQDLGSTTSSETTKSFNVSTTNRFSYYRIVINQVYNTVSSGLGAVANIGYWNLYGQYEEFISFK
jgi:hypothetical protein